MLYFIKYGMFLIIRYLLKVLVDSIKMVPFGTLIPHYGADPHPPWVSTPLACRLGVFYSKLDTLDDIMLAMKSNVTALS